MGRRFTSTLHAVAISALAAYLFLWTDPFSDDPTDLEVCRVAAQLSHHVYSCFSQNLLIPLNLCNAVQLWKCSPLKRHTKMSSAAMGWSLGYFALDIALIMSYFPVVRALSLDNGLYVDQ